MWFLGCTHPWYVITKSDSYIHNFRSILKDDGCVVYSDGWSRDQPSDGWSLNKLDVFGWKECTATVLDKTRDLPQKIREQLCGISTDDDAWDLVSFLLRQLEEVCEGVYRFSAVS